MSDTVEITVRLPAKLQARVDAVARALDRPPEWVIEQAVEAFLEIENIRQALAEADAGDFASDAEVEEVFAKWQSHKPHAR